MSKALYLIDILEKLIQYGSLEFGKSDPVALRQHAAARADAYADRMHQRNQGKQIASDARADVENKNLKERHRAHIAASDAMWTRHT